MSQSFFPRPRRGPLALGLVILTFVPSLLTACGSDSGGSSSTGSGETSNSNPGAGLKLGALLPVTGDLASIGQNMVKAVDLAVATVNACGGVNGAPVAITIEDDQTDPAAGSAAMGKLVEVNDVAGVVGAFASSVSTAAVVIARDNKVVLISPGSTSPVFTERAKNGEFGGFWARTAPSDAFQAPALAALAEKKGLTKVATVVINNDYGVGFEQQFVKSFNNLGGKVTNEGSPVRYDPKATTLDSEAAAAFSGKPDAVAAILYAETGGLLLKSAFEQGLSEGVTVLLTDGVMSEAFVDKVGKTADGKSILTGALGTVPGADGDGLEKFQTLWQEKTGQSLAAFAAHSWDAAILLMLAAQAAQENTGTAIQSKLRDVANAPGTAVSDPCEALALLRKGEEIDYQGASGKVDIDENGDVVGSYDVWTVKEDGSIEIIDNVTAETSE